MERFTFLTRLDNLPRADIEITADTSLPPEQLKKQGRITLSLDKTGKQLGFLHALLIQLGPSYYLIAGPSGVGKSTLAEKLVTTYGGVILANDWVAVERDHNNFYASDLNLEGQLKHEKRCLVSGVIILAESDDLQRDAYVPDTRGFRRKIVECFDAMPNIQARKLAEFWAAQRAKLPFYCVVPARIHDAEYTAESLAIVLRRLRPADDLMEVGVVGVGAIGTSLASELGKLRYVHKVHLFNRSKQPVLGLTLDLNQALYYGREETYVAHDTAEDLFTRSSVVFLCFREKDAPLEPDVPKRWEKVRAHVAMIRKYAEVASRVGFIGTIFVVTNPVDFLTYAYYAASQKTSRPQRTFQMYGIGLEGDVARAVFYGKRFASGLVSDDITIYGSHADDFLLQTPLGDQQNGELHNLVIGASDEVRGHDIRTVFGPVAAAVRTFRAYANSGAANVSLVQQDGYIGQKIQFKFGLPVASAAALPPGNKEILAGNKQKIAIYQDIL